MTDIAASASISVVNVVRDLEMGTATFDVVVTGARFVGYANGLFMSATSNTRQIIGTINTGTGQMTLKIRSYQPVGAQDWQSLFVSLPVGIYHGNMEIGAHTVPVEEDVSADLSLSFALTNVYKDGIVGAGVTATYTRFAVEG